MSDKKKPQFIQFFQNLLAESKPGVKILRIFERKAVVPASFQPLDSQLLRLSTTHASSPSSRVRAQDQIYYTSHGDTATYLADTYFHTREVLKQLGEEVAFRKRVVARAFCSVCIIV